MAVPDPATNGQFLYSKGLIQAATSAGFSLDIVTLRRWDADARPPGSPSPDGQRWWIASDRPRTTWASARSRWPHIANRTNTRAMRQLLRERLRRDDGHPWDAIVFDSLSVGWALRDVLRYLRHCPRRPMLIYAAHNHEASVARRLAGLHPHPLKRQINRLDALKVARLENALARCADLITADAPEDCELFRREHPKARVEWLPPAFLGEPVNDRRIGPSVPRRAIMLGSFDWLPKRLNLVEFLRIADPIVAAARVELQVVGAADREFLDQMRAIAPGTRFTGPVEDPRPYLAEARLGIAAERIGGGFKLKTLDYVFNRVPMAALAGTIPGLPVAEGESAIIRPDAAALARRIIEVIDDFETLNRMQTRAYDICGPVFALSNVGRVLASADTHPAASAPGDEELRGAIAV